MLHWIFLLLLQHVQHCVSTQNMMGLQAANVPVLNMLNVY